MPAAEPADSTPVPALNSLEPAPVIHLDSRRPDARGRSTVNHNPPGTPHPSRPDPGGDPTREIAHHIETVFNGHHSTAGKRMTLTDPDTATTFVITVDVLIEALHGAHAQGIVTDDQRNTLITLAQGIRQAPHHI